MTYYTSFCWASGEPSNDRPSLLTASSTVCLWFFYWQHALFLREEYGWVSITFNDKIFSKNHRYLFNHKPFFDTDSNYSLFVNFLIKNLELNLSELSSFFHFLKYNSFQERSKFRDIRKMMAKTILNFFSSFINRVSQKFEV